MPTIRGTRRAPRPSPNMSITRATVKASKMPSKISASRDLNLAFTRAPLRTYAGRRPPASPTTCQYRRDDERGDGEDEEGQRDRACKEGAHSPVGADRLLVRGLDERSEDQTDDQGDPGEAVLGHRVSQVAEDDGHEDVEDLGPDRVDADEGYSD